MPVSDTHQPIELSIVIPCRNEADSIEHVISSACYGVANHGLAAEVVVVDNGSIDGSRDIAAISSARVVAVDEAGYGKALRCGIEASKGQYIVIGDADGSYNLAEAYRFLALMKEGFDLVQGCRFPSGGGRIEPGAMPFLHRWIGNPVISATCRQLFPMQLHDVFCGMRGFSRTLYDDLALNGDGMEFAVEMVVKAGLSGALIREIPLTLHRDLRVNAKPHIRTFRDGWRTLVCLLEIYRQQRPQNL